MKRLKRRKRFQKRRSRRQKTRKKRPNKKKGNKDQLKISQKISFRVMRRRDLIKMGIIKW
jgi:hypothetical protein